LELAKIKGVTRAKLIEKIFRLETKHFTSKQYQLCGSAGMEKGKWMNLDESKLSYIEMNDNHPALVKEVKRTFIKWNSVLDFCLFLSNYIDRHEGNYARWNSTDLNKQAKYMSSVAGVTNKFIV
jgi:hypothetical protein